MTWLEAQRVPGIVDLTPGIRSLQVHYDSRAAAAGESLLDLVAAAERELPAIDDMQVPTRIVHLPLSWDDSQTPAGDREVHAVGAPGRAVVPEQPRVHPPHQRPRQTSTR